MKNVLESSCEICYQIKCKECGWIASDEEVQQIQSRVLTACPLCGWVPTA